MKSNAFRRLSLFAAFLAAGVLGAVSNAAAQSAPVFSSYTVLGISSFTVSWTGADSYQAFISTGAFPNGFPGNQNSADGLTGPNLSATFSSPALFANTTYYVEILNDNGAAYTSFAATSTLADAPAATAGPPSAVANTIQAFWNSGANLSATLYDCQISTDPLFSVLTAENFAPSAPPAAAQTIFANLAFNTAYYLRVQAINNNGIPSAGGFVALPGPTYTPPASLSQGFTGVSETLAAAVWSGGANPPGTTYNAVVSTTYPPQTSPYVSVRTTNLYTTFSGLNPNNLYYGAVAAVPNGGGTPLFTQFLVSTITLANPPLAGATVALSSASGPVIDASWLANGNPTPTGTNYSVQFSTMPDFAPLAGTQSAALTSATISGLSSFTTYYLQVQAINDTGIPTTFVSLPAVETLSSPPGAAPFTAITTSTLQANWTPDGSPAPNTYAVVLSTGVLPNGFALNQSSTTANLFEAFAGLSPNTTYYVAVSSAVGAGIDAPLGSAITLAVAPATGTVAAISPNSITATWGAPANPPGTLYQLQASTDATFNPALAPIASSTTATTTATISGLAVLTSYYLQVQAINFAGAATTFVPFGPALTWPNLTPAVPVLSSATLGTSSVTWSWSGVSLANGYFIVNSTGGNISGVLPISSFSWTDAGLSTNTSYTRSLVAFNGIGVSTSLPLAAVTLAAAPTLPSAAVVGFSSVTLSWSANTNPSGTRYAAELWEVVGATTTAVSTSTSQGFSGIIPGATCFMDVYALNSAGVATARTAPASVFLPLVLFDSATIYPNTGGSLFLYTADGPVSVVFPAGTFPVPVTATLYWPPADPANPYLSYPSSLPNALSHAAAMTPTFVGTELTVSPALQPSQLVSITLGYQATSVAGLDTGELAMAYYDPVENLFVPIAASSNPSLKQVTGRSPHLSFYEIMAVIPATDLSSAKIYPNPFRPALGHTAITFSQLPPNTRIRIYTVTGELVRDLSTDDTGIARWDATNGGGQNVASGGYFALVQGVGRKSILKVMIQR